MVHGGCLREGSCQRRTTESRAATYRRMGTLTDFWLWRVSSVVAFRRGVLVGARITLRKLRCLAGKCVVARVHHATAKRPHLDLEKPNHLQPVLKFLPPSAVLSVLVFCAVPRPQWREKVAFQPAVSPGCGIFFGLTRVARFRTFPRARNRQPSHRPRYKTIARRARAELALWYKRRTTEAHRSSPMRERRL